MANNENPSFSLLDHDAYFSVGGKAKVDRRKSSLYESGARKKLADISNFPKHLNLTGVGKSQFLSNSDKVYSDKLQKEKISLLKLLEEKNKIIKLSGSELQKVVVNMQRAQQQNLQLAQANSQMLAELNIGKDRLKAMQHQLGCTNNLLRIKEMEQKENLNVTICQQCQNQARVGVRTCENDVSEIEKANRNQCNLPNTNRNPPREIQGFGHSTVIQLDSMEKTEDESVCLKAPPASCKSEEVEPEKEDIVLVEEKSENKRVRPRRNSAIYKHEGPKSEDMVLTKVKTENKRVRPRRDSANFKREESKPKEEEMVEITDTAKLPDCPLSLGSNEGSIGQSLNSHELKRSCIARPSRLAAQKVQSYKEVPVNVKMRRPE